MSRQETARLRAVLDAVGAATFSQVDLAEAAGVSIDTLYAYALGRRHPSTATAKAVLRALRQHQKRLNRAVDRLERVVD